VGAWREVKNDELVMRRFGKRVRSWLNRFMGMGLPKICEDCMNVEYVVCGKGEGLFLCRMDYQTLADHCILNSCRDRCSGDVPLAKGLKIWL
jgi:nitrate reductase beta subunit